MYESKSVIAAWQAEARAEGLAEGMALGMIEARRADLLRALQIRYAGALPPDLSAEVRDIGDMDRLCRWFDAALTSTNVEVFRAVVAAADATATIQRPFA